MYYVCLFIQPSFWVFAYHMTNRRRGLFPPNPAFFVEKSPGNEAALRPQWTFTTNEIWPDTSKIFKLRAYKLSTIFSLQGKGKIFVYEPEGP